MRTTITLDDDNAARLERAVRERGITFKEAVNMAIRAGFAAEPAAQPPPPYIVPTFHLGLRPGVDWDRAGHLDADLEDEETRRKLVLGK